MLVNALGPPNFSLAWLYFFTGSVPVRSIAAQAFKGSRELTEKQKNMPDLSSVFPFWSTPILYPHTSLQSDKT